MSANIEISGKENIKTFREIISCDLESFQGMLESNLSVHSDKEEYKRTIKLLQNILDQLGD